DAYKRNDWPASSKFLSNMEQGATDAATQGKAIYWQAGIAAKQGKTNEAKASWQRTAQTSPLSYYGFMALKKIKGEEALSATPAVPPEWKQAPVGPSTAAGNSPTDKSGSWDLHLRKAEALNQIGLGKLAQTELEASLRQNADKAAALGRMLE